MNMIYNSPNYCVVEFRGVVREGKGSVSGYEIMDKTARRELFLEGDMAKAFRDDVAKLIQSEPSVEEVDDYLSRFDALMSQPVVLH